MVHERFVGGKHFETGPPTASSRIATIDSSPPFCSLAHDCPDSKPLMVNDLTWLPLSLSVLSSNEAIAHRDCMSLSQTHKNPYNGQILFPPNCSPGDAMLHGVKPPAGGNSQPPCNIRLVFVLNSVFCPLRQSSFSPLLHPYFTDDQSRSVFCRPGTSKN